MIASNFLRQFLVASAVFVIAGIAALWFDELLILLIPFAWIIVPVVINFVASKTSWLYYVLFALLPLSGEVNFTPALGMDVPDEFLMMLITGVFFIKSIYKPAVFPKQLFRHPLILLLVLHVCWLIISCFYSNDSWLSIKFVLAKSWFIVPFVILPSIFLCEKSSIRVLVLLLALPMLFVVAQTLARHAFYGFSFEGIKETLSPFFRNHVTYSSMLVCLLVVAWGAYKLTPALASEKTWIRIALFVGAVGLLFAFSRGAWLALLIGIIAGWAIRKKVIGWFLATAVVLCVCVGAWLMTDKKYLEFAHDYNTTVFHEDFGEHLEATIALKDVSNAERFYRWVAASNMIAEKPITGFGLNNFYNSYKPYTVAPFRTWVSDNPEHSTVHNYFLLTLLEQGLPGLLFFCALLFGMIVYSQRLYHKLDDVFYKMVALVIGVVLVMIGALIFMSDLIETDKIGSLFWLCLGLLVVLSGKVEAGFDCKNSKAGN